MADAVNPQVVDAVTQSNVKTISEGPALIAGLSQQATARQFAQMGDAAVQNAADLGAIVRSSLATHLSVMGSLSARAAGYVLDGSGQPQQMADLNAALAGGQQSAKIANTTPPETAIGQQLANLSAAMASVLAFLQAQSNGPSPVPQPAGK